MSQPTALIIGAGYAGIALANLLGKAGYAVTVVEKNSSAGGRIAVRKQDGFTFDLGPSWYLIPEAFENYYALFDESPTKRLELQKLTPGFRVFFDSRKPVTIQGSLELDAITFESLELGAGEKLRSYVRQSNKIYRTAVDHFIYSNFERPIPLIARRIWPLLLASYRSLDAHVGKSFSSQYIKQILEYQAVFLGNSPFELPALYSLMSTLDFDSGVYYPRKGMAFLAEDLVQLGNAYDISYHFNSPVQEITTEDSKATGVLLENGSHISADIVVSAADLHHTETTLLKRSAQSYPEAYWKKKQPGPSGLVVSLGISSELPELTHHSLLFVDAWKENFDAIYKTKTLPENASIYICNPTKSDKSLAPAGHENLFILVPLPTGIDLSEQEVQDAAAHYIEQSARMIGVPDLASRIVSQHIFSPSDFSTYYNAWEENAFGGQSHLLFQSAFFRTRNKSKKISNLYYVGASTLPGIGLPMCLISAEQTFKKIQNITADGPLRNLDIDLASSTPTKH